MKNLKFILSILAVTLNFSKAVDVNVDNDVLPRHNSPTIQAPVIAPEQNNPYAFSLKNFLPSKENIIGYFVAFIPSILTVDNLNSLHFKHPYTITFSTITYLALIHPQLNEEFIVKPIKALAQVYNINESNRKIISGISQITFGAVAATGLYFLYTYLNLLDKNTYFNPNDPAYEDLKKEVQAIFEKTSK